MKVFRNDGKADQVVLLALLQGVSESVAVARELQQRGGGLRGARRLGAGAYIADDVLLDFPWKICEMQVTGT